MNHVYLIAEDQKNTQAIVEHAFTKAGFDFPIQFVSDGQEALDYLRGAGKFSDRSKYPFPALLLLDFNMPKLNGLEVLKVIRADSKLKKLVVVMLSSSIEEKQIEKAFEIGVNSYVEKPTDFNELVHSIICINQYWFGCNHFPHSSHGIVRPNRRHRLGIEQATIKNAKSE